MRRSPRLYRIAQSAPEELADYSGEHRATLGPKAIMEGVQRLRTIAHVLMLYGTMAGVAAWFLCTFLLRSLGILELLFLAGAPAVSGGILRLFAWVVEGFLASDRHTT
jgi:hypothetical protein